MSVRASAFSGQNGVRKDVLGLPRQFLFLTGDVISALLLSQLVYWSERCTNPGGWVYKSEADWRNELNLKRRAMERARRDLKRLGLIETTLRKANGSPTTHYRVCHEALAAALAYMGDKNSEEPHSASTGKPGAHGQPVQGDMCTPSIRTCRNHPDPQERNAQMEMDTPSRCICGNHPDAQGQNAQVEMDETSESVTETTTEITSETTTYDVGTGADECGSALVRECVSA